MLDLKRLLKTDIRKNANFVSSDANNLRRHSNTHLRKAQQMKLISLIKNKFSDSDKMSSISQSVHKMPENILRVYFGSDLRRNKYFDKSVY